MTGSLGCRNWLDRYPKRNPFTVAGKIEFEEVVIEEMRLTVSSFYTGQFIFHYELEQLLKHTNSTSIAMRQVGPRLSRLGQMRKRYMRLVATESEKTDLISLMASSEGVTSA